ncbi:MAG: hypothetical protein WD230_05590, partial [Cucumibacter sp.]
IEWIERVEFEVYGLPQPDLVLLLDIPVPVAQTLIATKSETGGKTTYTLDIRLQGDNETVFFDI